MLLVKQLSQMTVFSREILGQLYYKIILVADNFRYLGPRQDNFLSQCCGVTTYEHCDKIIFAAADTFPRFLLGPDLSPKCAHQIKIRRSSDDNKYRTS